MRKSRLQTKSVFWSKKAHSGALVVIIGEVICGLVNKVFPADASAHFLPSLF